MSIINLVIIVVIARRIYWFERYGTIKKSDVYALKRAMNHRSSDAAAFYYPTAVQMVEELYPNAPKLEPKDFKVIVSHFMTKKDMRIPEYDTWDEVIGDYLLDKQATTK